MKSKRGQGLPMNTIVIAAIVLIVMVVLIYIFVGSMAQTTERLQDCADKGGQCRANPLCEGEDEVTIGRTKDCEDKNLPYCCVKTTKETETEEEIQRREGDLPII